MTHAPLSHAYPGLLLNSPDTVLSAIPFMLGFTPADSMVVVWLVRGQVLVTQRADLPTTDVQDAWLDMMFGHAAVRAADEVVVVAYSDRTDAADVVLQVRARAEFLGLSVMDALRTDGARWWSVLCTDGDCCGEQGRPIDPSAQAAIGAEFAVRGVAPSGAREDLERELAVDRDGRAATTVILDEIAAEKAAMFVDDRDGTVREQWRTEVIGAILDAFQSPPLDELDRYGAAANLIEGLADIRVRDSVLWAFSSLGGDELRSARAIFTATVRLAPPGRAAPVATCAAIMSWLLGDGARASIALERAIHDDPEYSLAQLITAAVQGGLPPGAWRESMTRLTWDECRYGAVPVAPERRKKRAKKRSNAKK